MLRRNSEDIIEMYPLDFEEFLWANGISEEVIEALKKFYRNESPVPAEFLHE
jgi:predicted AAA+ superfamily ATPase